MAYLAAMQSVKKLEDFHYSCQHPSAIVLLHPEIANSLHVTANDLRAGYQAALANNPNLTFGQYVAATRLAQNLGSRDPNITRDAILAGLARGDSIGKTLQNLGLSKNQAKAAVKQADEQMKESRRRG